MLIPKQSARYGTSKERDRIARPGVQVCERKRPPYLDAQNHASVLWNLTGLMPPVIRSFDDIDFDRAGKHHYQVAFHLDGSWGYSLLSLTVINGKRGANANGVICFGGTHGNEYEGQIAVKRLGTDLDPERMTGKVVLIPQLSESACVANSRTSPLDGVNMKAQLRVHERNRNV